MRHLVLCKGVGCTPWRPLVSAVLPVAFVAGAEFGAARGRMYALASLGLRRSASGFSWQWRLLVLCKGSDVRPGIPWSPLLCRWLLRGRRSTWCSARGRMYALASLGLRCSAGGFCVAGAALGALQGVGCTPWRPLVSTTRLVAFVWQVLFGALQGVGCTPRRPLVSAALPVAFAWQVRHLVLCKGPMYALASLGLRRSAGGFCLAGAPLGALQGVGCTPWSSQLCQWLMRGRCGTMCTPKGSDVRPGIPWSPPLVALPVAFAWQVRHLVLCKRSDVRPGVPLSPPLSRWAFAWQVWDNVHSQGVGCTPRWLLRGIERRIDR